MREDQATVSDTCWVWARGYGLGVCDPQDERLTDPVRSATDEDGGCLRFGRWVVWYCERVCV